MSTCPYCGTSYRDINPPITLSKRQRDVYEAVAAGGSRGITVKALLSTVYGSEPPKTGWGVLRVNVFEINRKLKERGQRIKGRRDIGYILIKEKDDENEVC
jgi:hypothetical protein